MEYKSYNSNKLVNARKFTFLDCSRCRFKCSEQFDTAGAKQLFENYWLEHGSIDYRRAFCLKHVCKSKDGKSWKRYFLPAAFGKKEKKEPIQVCQRFFLSALGENRRFVEYTLEFKTDRRLGFWPIADRRGKNVPRKKLTHDEISHVSDFISDTITVESHYTRKNSSKIFSAQYSSIRDMYRNYLT